MIYLTKGQPLFDNPGLVVCDQTGYYEDGTSVLCAVVYDPESPACRYEAKFIAYGNVVYNITEPEKLMEQVLKIDPKSLFGKSNQETVEDKVVENIQTVDSTETPAPVAAPAAPQSSTPEPVFTTPEQVEAAISTSTPATTVETVVTETPVIVTEPEIITPVFEEATTTIETLIESLPQVVEAIDPSQSTTTPLTEITF